MEGFTLVNTSNLAMKNTNDAVAEQVSETYTASADNTVIRLDLSRFDSREMVQEAVRQSDAEKTVKVEKKPEKRMLSVSSILYCLAFAGLALLLLFNYLDLTVLTDKVADKQNELVELQNRESILRTEYEKRLDLRSIEEYAVNTLGMVKTERGQIEYLEIKAPETISMIVPEEQKNLSYYFANLAQSFNAVLKNLD